MINENGRALGSHAGLIEEAPPTEAFVPSHTAWMRLASSYTIGEYLLPSVISKWKNMHPRSHVRVEIARTAGVFEAVATSAVDIGFVEGEHTHPHLTIRPWRTDDLAVVGAPMHPLARGEPTPEALSEASWVLREPGSGTRQASDRWLLPNLRQVRVGLELGNNEAVKRTVASGVGLACLSRLVVQDALKQGWLVELATTMPRVHRALSVVLNPERRLGAATEAFVKHCFESC